MKNKNKIRGVSIAFSLFMALILFQNPNYGSSWIILGCTLMVFIYALLDKFMNKRNFSIQSEQILLLLFLIFSSIVSLCSSINFSTISPFIIHVLLCIVLFNINISDKEYAFIKNVYIYSMVIYSILVTRSCIISSDRYLHGDIELLGTMFDPNYLGVPITFASVLTMGDILFQKGKMIIKITAFIIFCIAILFTASRGNFLGLVAGNILLLLNFLKFDQKTKRSSVIKVLLYLIVLVITGMVVLSYFDFTSSFERITTYDEGADNGRFEIWTKSLQLIKDNIVFGIGLSGSYHITGMANHNTYIEIITETGLVGLFLMIPIFIKALIGAYRYNKCLFFAMIALLFQIAFLDTLTKRCLWPYLCWVAMLPKHKHDECYE